MPNSSAQLRAGPRRARGADAMSGFVHLRVHTEFSLVDSVLAVGVLMDGVRDHGMPSVAMTDQSNVFALVKFYDAAVDRGIKPIIGADLWIADSLDDRDPSRLTLLCMDQRGYRQLSRLLTQSSASGQRQGRSIVLKDSLEPEAVDGLIALSGAQFGDLGRAITTGVSARIEAAVSFWSERFPDRYYVELQRLGRPEEAEYIGRAAQLAAQCDLPVVATNDVRFLRREDFEAHEARVCIQQGRTLADPTRPRDYSEHQYLKSVAEMEALFSDLPEALANSVEIARRCNFAIELGKVYLPEFEIPEAATTAAYLDQRARQGLTERLARHAPEGTDFEPYVARLERELETICRMGFEGYFLIVADFINWARNNGVPVGPGRGSGAGSLVAYALGVTDLDPIEHDLLFERFLNPERVSMPDFDVDFCIDGRDRVIDYVAQRYGRDRVSQIITFGTMAARAVVRDVGRVLGHPYGYVDRIAKLIPFEIGITLEKALADDEELRGLYRDEEEVRALIDLARPLEGLARNAGTHAGGVVIAPTPLTEFMPIYQEPGGTLLTQFDKDDVEAIGLVKFDFLGLKTLTIIDRAVAAANVARSSQGLGPIDIENLPMNDQPTYELLRSCRTTAIFQLESAGMRDLIKRLQPDHFDDLVAILALFRPGPLQSGMVDDFISRKHGRNSGAIDYLHPDLEPVLRSTYGVILYQEQVMQIARVLSGYSLGGADLLRRAMGKKKPEEMAKQRSVFVAGATDRGYDPRRASEIFDLIEKFAGYGFNKSHSAAYALIAYRTAWLKAHYPEAFMAAVLTADMDNTDKLVLLKDDCKQLGIELLPPSVNRSEHAFTVAGAKQIIYGLGAIKGVGRGVVEALVAERQANGPYIDLLDLCKRVDQHKLNRRVLEALVRAGALDGLGANRATLFNAIPAVLKLAERSAHALAAGQAGLFGDGETDESLSFEITEIRDWTDRERLTAERESLGLYLSGHPFNQYAEHCRHFTNGAIAKVVSASPGNGGGNGYAFQPRRNVTVAGLVMDLRRRGSRTSIVLDDDSDRIEVTLFDDAYAQFKHLLNKDAVLVVDGQLRFDDFINAWRVTAQRVRSVDDAIEEYARRLTIHCDSSSLEIIGNLRETLQPFTHGQCEVCIEYAGPSARALLTLGDHWSVRPTRELRERLSQLPGAERYSIHYPRHIG
jgi:DNA polymerase-3 subunit alpha